MGAPPPPPDLGWGVPFEERMRVELLGARYSRWLNGAGKPQSVGRSRAVEAQCFYWERQRLQRLIFFNRFRGLQAIQVEYLIGCIILFKLVQLHKKCKVW